MSSSSSKALDRLIRSDAAVSQSSRMSQIEQQAQQFSEWAEYNQALSEIYDKPFDQDELETIKHRLLDDALQLNGLLEDASKLGQNLFHVRRELDNAWAAADNNANIATSLGQRVLELEAQVESASSQQPLFEVLQPQQEALKASIELAVQEKVELAQLRQEKDNFQQQQNLLGQIALSADERAELDTLRQNTSQVTRKDMEELINKLDITRKYGTLEYTLGQIVDKLEEARKDGRLVGEPEDRT